MLKMNFPNASAAIAAAALSVLPASAQTVTVDSGTLRGARAGAHESYKGIPYAQAKRWHAPAPVAKWQGVRDATAFGADCIHVRADWEADRNGAPMSEDCLFLNIWAPAKHAKGGAPVMLWIHGGSFTSGSGSQALYEGSALAQRGVVVVTINYRLGRFGFFAHPALTAEAGTAPTGNWGFMDQVAALKWVRANIRAFGGDPARVTIFGESAGGRSVNTLMAMPAARGLFARAIAESGGGGRDETMSLATAEAKGKAFAVSEGVPGDDLAALRAIPADKLLPNLASWGADSPTYSGPMIDGRLVREPTDAAFRAGRQASVPYLAGANSYEISFFPEPLRKGFTAMLGKQFGAAQPGIQSAYGSAEAYERNLGGDALFVEPSRYLAGLAAAHHSYLYLFDYVAEGHHAPNAGVPHGSELQFVFGTLNLLGVPPTDADRAMAGLVGDYWVDFARGGTPNGGGRTTWPGYTDATGARMVFSASGAAPGSAASPGLDALAAYQDAKHATSLPK
jgi:para-nitrobenzyl esterase